MPYPSPFALPPPQIRPTGSGEDAAYRRSQARGGLRLQIWRGGAARSGSKVCGSGRPTGLGTRPPSAHGSRGGARSWNSPRRRAASVPSGTKSRSIVSSATAGKKHGIEATTSSSHLHDTSMGWIKNVDEEEEEVGTCTCAHAHLGDYHS
ncbi:unnamed protein product [Urochloa humidicola]